MSAGHNILDHFSATLAKKVRTISKSKGVSTVDFVRRALTKACSNEEEQEGKLIQEILKGHEQTLADAAAGRIETFHTKEEVLAHFQKIKAYAEKE